MRWAARLAHGGQLRRRAVLTPGINKSRTLSCPARCPAPHLSFFPLGIWASHKMTSFTHNARKTFGDLFKSCWKPSTSNITADPLSATSSEPSSKIVASNVANPETNNQDLPSRDLPSSAQTNDAPSHTRSQRLVPQPLELGAASNYVLDRPEIDATASDADLRTGGTSDPTSIRPPEPSIQQKQADLSDKTPEPRPLPPLSPIDSTSVGRPQPMTHTPASTRNGTTSSQSTLDLNAPAATPDTARPSESRPRSRAVLVLYSL
jgi:hypothetical protein